MLTIKELEDLLEKAVMEKEDLEEERIQCFQQINLDESDLIPLANIYGDFAVKIKEKADEIDSILAKILDIRMPNENERS